MTSSANLDSWTSNTVSFCNNSSTSNLMTKKVIAGISSLLTLTAFSIFLLAPETSKAAEVIATQDTWGNPLIEIRGEIERGDLARVQQVAVEK